MSTRILTGDMRERLRDLPDASIDSVVTDPPYHLTSIVKRFGASNAAPAKSGKTGAYARASRGFMGQTWDGGDVAFQSETWAEVLRVMKPGAHLLAFSGTRTYHRMVCAIEDAGFEVRDGLLDLIASDAPVRLFMESLDAEQLGAFIRCIEDSQFGGLLAWIYGSGFPKSHNIAKALNREGLVDNLDEARAWQGWGTALKPALEPIVLARKPLDGTIAANVLMHGTGALNIDRCRVEGAPRTTHADGNRQGSHPAPMDWGVRTGHAAPGAAGRWPANVIHDGSDEVVAGFPETKKSIGGGGVKTGIGLPGEVRGGGYEYGGDVGFGDTGSAARFFYSAKADQTERHAGCEDLEKRNSHPTVKPIDLMRWLIRLVTPRGGLVLDPFMGSGSTLIAAHLEQCRAIGVEMTPEYVEIARRRIAEAQGLFVDVEAA